ncbi:hypothetical protein HZC00_01035 [Candidatus Kaiserbacteria bacterium]|nr:hypothetical protein [Candidatus Kaiserbacteria bacterium]
MEKLKQGREQLKQALLKKKLVSGTLSPEVFLDELFKRDQSTSHRQSAEENIAILEDAEVRELLITPDSRRQYFNLLSISHFHVGQNKAGADVNGAVESFEAALVAANEITGEDYEWWRAYVEGTVAYFKKDIPVLQDAISRTLERNREILESLLEGLQKRGTIDYMTDISKQTV